MSSDSLFRSLLLVVLFIMIKKPTQTGDDQAQTFKDKDSVSVKQMANDKNEYRKMCIGLKWN